MQRFDDFKKRSEDYFHNLGLSEGNEGRIAEFEKWQKQRQQEWDDSKDLLEQERAGLAVDTQKEIMKLDENNNLSYKYLREVGSNFQYQPHEMNNKWKNRLYRRFDTLNKDDDRIIHLGEILNWPYRMQSLCKSNQEEKEKVKQSLTTYYKHRGVTTEGLNRENWVEANRVFAEAEKERKKRGEPSLSVAPFNDYLDIVDEDGDSFLSLQEMKRMFNVFRIPEETAYTVMLQVDTKRIGKVERKDFYDLFNKFWFHDYDEKLDGLFGFWF